MSAKRAHTATNQIGNTIDEQVERAIDLTDGTSGDLTQQYEHLVALRNRINDAVDRIGGKIQEIIPNAHSKGAATIRPTNR